MLSSQMPPHLRAIARFIVARQHRLTTFGRPCAVRLAREGDKLAGTILTEPAVAFFDSNGELVRQMSIEEFEREFSSDLADHHRADPEPHASATPHSEPSILFGAQSLSPRHA